MITQDGDLAPAETDGLCQVMDRLISTGGLGVSSLSVRLSEVQLIPSPEPPHLCGNRQPGWKKGFMPIIY